MSLMPQAETLAPKPHMTTAVLLVISWPWRFFVWTVFDHPFSHQWTNKYFASATEGLWLHA